MQYPVVQQQFICLLSLNLKKDDIVPSLSFVSQINVIKILAKPILVDCTSLDNWNIDIKKVKTALQKQKLLLFYIACWVSVSN